MSDDPQPNKSPLHQADRLHTLNEISRVVSGTLDLQTLYDTIFEQIGRVMDTTLFYIALLQADGKGVQVPYYREAGKLSEMFEFPHGGTVTSTVIDRGVPLVFRTVDEYSEFAVANDLPEVIIGDEENIPSRSQIYVPLNTGSRTIGALSVQSTCTNAYSEDDAQTLTVIASQAAVAIVNARLYEQSRESVRQMQELLHIAQLLSGSLDLPTVLGAILGSMHEVLPYYFAAVLLPDHARRELEIARTIGPMEEWQHQARSVPFGDGVTGQCFERGESIIVADVRDFPGVQIPTAPTVRSEMAVPLKRSDVVVGVLDVQRSDVAAFSQDEVALISLFASQAAIAIENARLFTEQQQRVDELQTIQSIVQKLTPQHKIPTIASLINEGLLALIEYHSCRVFLLEEDGRSMLPVDFEDEDSALVRVELGRGYAGWIAVQGMSLNVPNTLEDDRGIHIAGTPSRVESLIGAPLVYEGKVRGVITLTKLGSHQFDDNSVRLLEIVAAQAAIAFDRARLYEELRTEAITDELTNLYNRRYLLARFKEESTRARRHHHTLIAFMLDIDRFKSVNDSYGHDAGDIVLRELAGLTRAVVRAEDIVSRYGGEEFCILLPEIPLDDAEQVAERLRTMIERHTMPRETGTEHITVSLGMAILRDQDEGTDLFSRADQAMYQVKRTGGNRTCIMDEDDFRFLGDSSFPRSLPKQA